MGARIRIPLWMLLPAVAVSVVALGAVAVGAAGIPGTRGYLTRQTDSSLLACAGGAMGQRFVNWPASAAAPSNACDMELLSASGKLLSPPAPALVPDRSFRPAARGWRRTRHGRSPCLPPVRAEAGASC